jgi:hypothetical protein
MSDAKFGGTGTVVSLNVVVCALAAMATCVLGGVTANPLATPKYRMTRSQQRSESAGDHCTSRNVANYNGVHPMPLEGRQNERKTPSSLVFGLAMSS